MGIATLRQKTRRTLSRAKPLEAALSAWFTKFGQYEARRAISAGEHVAKADTEKSLTKELDQILTRFGVRSISDGYKAATGSNWVVPPQGVTDYLKSKDIKVKRIISDTRKDVQDAIRTLLLDAQGETPQPAAGEIARRIRTQFFGDPEKRLYTFSSERAAAIARTELVQAENTGIMDGYRATGVEEIEWLAYKDGRSGDRHHEEMDGVTIKVGEYFKTPLGNKLRYPGDPLGSIQDVINCRCNLATVRRKK